MKIVYVRKKPYTISFISQDSHPRTLFAASAMDLSAYSDSLRAGKAANFPADATSLAFAQKLDEQDKLSHLRNEFNLPTKTSMKKRALDGTVPCMCNSHLSGEFKSAN